MTGGGEVMVGRAAGFVEATTGGGDIEIGPVAGWVTATTGAGDVRVTIVDAGDAEQRVEVASGSGIVVVVLPSDFDGEFDLETAYTEKHGETRIESPWKLDRAPVTDWDDRQGTARRYVRARGTAGSGRGLVRIETVNGDIRLERSGSARKR